MEDGTGAPSLVPRCCHIVRWSDFNGYGFNLHAEKGKAGQYIGKVDAGSPAEAAGLRQGDRIVEVNGINIGNENHQQVVGRIKSGGAETRLTVVDAETDMQYKSSMTVVRGDLPEVRFITSARDDEIDSTPNTNGSAFTTTTPATSSEPPTGGYSAPQPTTAVASASPHFPVRQCKLCKWPDFDGYGFNLHAEKDKPGQFIGVVDPASPAEMGGLKEGDRIVEVNGENIEGLSHGGVIQRVKAGGDRTELLVLDREADAYYTSQGLTVASDPALMTGVTLIVTPPTSKGDVVDINSNEQSSEPEPSLTTFTTSEEPTSYSFEKSEEAEDAAPAAETEVAAPVEESEVAAPAAETEVAAPAAETEVTNAEEDVNLSTLPEPNVSLSDEESEAIVAVVAEAVESTPEPPAPLDEETVPNGHEVEKEEEDREEKKEEEEEEEQVVVVTSTSDVTPADDVVVGDAVEEKREEEEEEQEEGDVGMNDYEQVEVVTAAVAVSAYSAPPPPAAEDHADEDLGAASYGINGGAEVPEPEPEPEPEPRRVEPEPAPIPAPIPAPVPAPVPVAKAPEPVPVPEPEPAVIRSTVTSTSKPAPTGPAMGGDLHLFMSAAEMKERLKARKKQDPRYHKTSFEAKSKMFEKL